MKIKLSKTVIHNGHTYKSGVSYRVTNELGNILIKKSEKKVKKEDNEINN